MRLLSRTPAALLLAALPVLGLLPAAAQAAPGPRCSTGTPSSICLTALTVSPASVDTVAGGTVTVTATAAPGAPATACLFARWSVGYRPRLQPVRLDPVAGSPGTYRGPFVLPPGVRNGTYPIIDVTDCPVTRVWSNLNDAGGLPAPITVTGTPDTVPPVVGAVSVSATTVDATTTSPLVTVSAHLTDAGTGVGELRVGAVYTPDASADPRAGTPVAAAGPFTLVSGTPADGVWSGPLQLAGGTRGTWALDVVAVDRAQVFTSVGNAASVRTTTSAAPALPKPAGRTVYGNPITGEVTVTVPAGTPAATAVVVTSASPACGTLFGDPALPTLTFVPKRFLQTCTVKVRTVNAAGVSPEASVSFL